MYTKFTWLSLAQECVAHTGIVFSNDALRCIQTSGLLPGQKCAFKLLWPVWFSRVCLHFLLVKPSNFVNVQTNMFLLCTVCQSSANLHVWMLELCACIHVWLHALINWHDLVLVHNYPNQQLRARASSSSWGGSPTCFLTWNTCLDKELPDNLYVARQLAYLYYNHKFSYRHMQQKWYNNTKFMCTYIYCNYTAFVSSLNFLCFIHRRHFSVGGCPSSVNCR